MLLSRCSTSINEFHIALSVLLYIMLVLYPRLQHLNFGANGSKVNLSYAAKHQHNSSFILQCINIFSSRVNNILYLSAVLVVMAYILFCFVCLNSVVYTLEFFLCKHVFILSGIS